MFCVVDFVTRDVVGGTKAVVQAGAVRRKRVRNCFIMAASCCLFLLSDEL